ncbi:MAG TPA: hypothetical protein VHP32_12595 [Ignavibacteria bacterium]|nr:hypothetical protein [Ignavibacteria bacterium]
MNIKLLFLFLNLVFFASLSAQNVTEKKIFHLDYKGNPDPYNLILDSVTGKYIYMYYYEEQSKNFLIADGSVSEQFDFISISDTKFDKQGNFFTTAGNYNSDYGIDNYFLIINNKNVKNYDYIDSYSSYVNEQGQYVFIFKEFGFFKFGYINANGDMTQSESFDNIKPIQKTYPYVAPGDPQPNYNDMFFTDAQGRRGFVVIKDGKAGFWFGDQQMGMTDYSDINESSVVYDNNGNLAYVAKTTGKFYDYDNPGIGEFVVANNTQYGTFKTIITPIVFTSDNKPVYVVSDSIDMYIYKYYPVIGSERQTPMANGTAIDGFTGYIYDLRIDASGDIKYSATSVYPATISPMETEYGYDYMTYDVTNNNALELGVGIGQFKKTSSGGYLYSAVDQSTYKPEKKKYYIMEYSNGAVTKYSNSTYNYLLDYGYSPDGQFYYIMDKYGEYQDSYAPLLNRTIVNVNNKNYECQSVSYFGDAMTTGYICFGKNGDYAFAENKLLDTVTYTNVSYVMTNNGKLPFATTISTDAKGYNYITNMFYSTNGKLLYVGSLYGNNPESSYSENEIVIDSKPTGQVYGMLSFLNYDKESNTVSFLGQRGKDIYQVSIDLN